MASASRMLAATALAGAIALSGAGSSASALRRAVRGGDAKAARAALGALGLEPGRDGVRAAVAAAIAFPDDETYEAALAALARVREASFDALAAIAARERDHRARLVAIDALARSPLSGATTALVAALRDRHPACRLTAARALGGRRQPEGIEGLIGALEKIEKRRDPFWVVVKAALAQATGQEFGPAADWRSWWETVRERWDPGQVPAGPRRGSTSVNRAAGRKVVPEFFGLEVIARRIVFVIDTSDSMKHTAKLRSEDGGVRRAPMIELAKGELERVVRALPRDARFTIIAFSTGARHMTESVVPATAGFKAKAARFIRGLAPKGYTWTEEALAAAFEVNGATAIYLLSDGSPCKGGRLLPTGPILANVRKWNRFRRISIHAIGFPGSNVDFMAALAAQNGGEYRHVRLAAVR